MLDGDIHAALMTKIACAVENDAFFPPNIGYRGGFQCFTCILSVVLESELKSLRATSTIEERMAALTLGRRDERRGMHFKVLGELWKSLSREEQQLWNDRANYDVYSTGQNDEGGKPAKATKVYRKWPKKLFDYSQDMPYVMQIAHESVLGTLKALETKLRTQLRKTRISRAYANKTVMIPERVCVGTGVLTEIGLSILEFELFWSKRLDQYHIPCRGDTCKYYRLSTPEAIAEVFTIGDHTLHVTEMPEKGFKSSMGIKVFETCHGASRFGYVISTAGSNEYCILFEGLEEVEETIYIDPRNVFDNHQEREDKRREKTYTFNAVAISYSQTARQLRILWDRVSTIDGTIDFNRTS